MNELISIIVPVYKVENYLQRCVESLINQTYQNIEIILVDDGSPDRCGEMCEAFALQDARIRVYHKENGGLSDARNYGVSVANGAYIGFVDSDDYIHHSMYEKLYQAITKEKADVAECGVTRVYGNRNRVHCEIENLYEVMNEKQYFEEVLTSKKVYGSVWCKLIRKEIAKQVQFEKGKYYEDLFYNLELVQVAKKYVFTNQPHYYYFIRENSITTEKYSPKQLTIIEAMNNYYMFCEKNYPELIEKAFIRQSLAYLSIFNQLILDDYKNYSEFKEVYQFLKQNKKRIIKNSDASKQLKLSIIILNINLSLYRFLYKQYKKRMVLNK